MTTTITNPGRPLRRRGTMGVCAVALLAPASALAQPAAATSESVEEIVVTGSYLRSSTFQSSSPVDIIAPETLQRQAQTSVAAALSELPYITGGGFGQGGGQSGSTVNLRGLGSAATLVLLNGRRQARVPNTSSVVDVNTLVPEIMIGGVEILKDGASALYGTDAVAGVTNFRTKRNFTGLQLQIQGRWQTHAADLTPDLKKYPGNYRVSALWGAASENDSISAAIEHTRRDMVGYTGVPGPVSRRFVPVPLPNQLTSPLRDANGVLRSGAGSTTVRVDPDCGAVTQTSVRGTSCLYSFYPDQTYLSKQERTHFFVQGEHRFSDSLKLTAEAGYAKVTALASQTASPSISVSPPFRIPGESPAIQAAGGGSLFRARNASGQLLFAQRSASNPAVAARDAQGRVVVSGVDPASGIPFWEDVNYSGRVITSQGGLPTGGAIGPGEFARSNPVRSENEVMRLATGLEGQVAGWIWQTAFTYATNEQTNGTNDILPNELRQALAGFGGANCNPLTGQAGVGACQYFNPLIGSALAPAGSGAANTQETIDFFFKEIQNNFRTELAVIEVLVTGDLFELPAGPLGLAVGAQYRKEKWRVDFSPNQENGNTANGTVNRDVRADGITKSLFAEAGAPIFDSGVGKLTLNGALRYEESRQFSTFDPKIGAVYETSSGAVQLRGSWGSSFLAPSLFQQFTQSTGLVNLNSTYGGTRPSTAQPRVARVISGNPDLEPQEAKSWNLGVEIRPVRGLRLSVDRWRYRYRGLITEENAQGLVTQDDLSLAAGRGPTGRVVRDPLGNVLQVRTQFFNAASLVTSGFDLQASFDTSLGRYGDFGIDATATYVDKYDYIASATTPVLHAKGRWNDTNTSINPSFELRSQVVTRWNLGSHAVRATWNYSSAIDNDRAVATIAGDQTFWSVDTLDIAYTYSMENVLGAREASFAIGVGNLFNELPDTAGFEGHGTAFGIYDYQGRNAWVRLTARY